MDDAKTRNAKEEVLSANVAAPAAIVTIKIVEIFQKNA
jgi:hypothetical protein